MTETPLSKKIIEEVLNVEQNSCEDLHILDKDEDVRNYRIMRDLLTKCQELLVSLDEENQTPKSVKTNEVGK